MALTDSQTGGTIVCSGESSTPPQITLAGSCVVGDVLGYSSGWKRALATAGSVIQGRFIALQGGESGDVIAVSDTPTVGGRYGTTLTMDSVIYVAEGTSNGMVTDSAPGTTDDADTAIGFPLSSSEIQFHLNRRADSVSA